MDTTQDNRRNDVIKSRGLLFPKHPDIIRGPIRGLLREETYERKEADAILKVVRDGDRVMELGGGIGFMSTWIATNRHVDHVHVFEANPHLIPYIKSVHRTNHVRNATVHHALLGAENGTAEFYVRKKILASSMDKDAAGGVVEEAKVDVRAITEVMDELKPNVLVCDIEGAEVDVIPQMDLSGLRAAVIETHPQWIGPEGMNTVFRAFMDAGLAYYARGSMNKVISFRRNWMLR